MAKDQTELLTELKNGSSSFSLIGKVKLVEGGFGGAVQKEKSNWLGVNSKFGVEISFWRSSPKRKEQLAWG